MLNILDFELKDDGEYIVTFENQFSIIELKRGLVKYRLNSIRVDI